MFINNRVPPQFTYIEPLSEVPSSSTYIPNKLFDGDCNIKLLLLFSCTVLKTQIPHGEVVASVDQCFFVQAVLSQDCQMDSPLESQGMDKLKTTSIGVIVHSQHSQLSEHVVSPYCSFFNPFNYVHVSWNNKLFPNMIINWYPGSSNSSSLLYLKAVYSILVYRVNPPPGPCLVWDNYKLVQQLTDKLFPSASLIITRLRWRN